MAHACGLRSFYSLFAWTMERSVPGRHRWWTGPHLQATQVCVAGAAFAACARGRQGCDRKALTLIAKEGPAGPDAFAAAFGLCSEGRCDRKQAD